MSDEPLDQLLARLKAEIDDAEAGDFDREELARLAGAVEARLRGDVADHDHDDEGLLDELREGVERFEASHPRLSEAIGRIADGLAGMGI